MRYAPRHINRRVVAVVSLLSPSSRCSYADASRVDRNLINHKWKQTCARQFALRFLARANHATPEAHGFRYAYEIGPPAKMKRRSWNIFDELARYWRKLYLWFVYFRQFSISYIPVVCTCDGWWQYVLQMGRSGFGAVFGVSIFIICIMLTCLRRNASYLFFESSLLRAYIHRKYQWGVFGHQVRLVMLCVLTNWSQLCLRDATQQQQQQQQQIASVS